MSVTSITRDPPMNVCIVRITVDGDISQVTVPDYVVQQADVIRDIVKGTWRWFYSDVILVSADDTTGFFQFSDPTLTTLIPLSESNINRGSIYSVYVAPDGDDTTGNGSIINPYQTVSKAMSTITTATTSSQFNIVLTGGNILDTNIALKPNVNIIGNNTIVSVSGNVTIDPSWDSGANLASYYNFEIDCPNPVNLDFNLSATMHAHEILFDNFNVSNSNQLIINGKSSEVIRLSNMEGFTFNNLTLNVTLNNVAFLVTSSALSSISGDLNVPSVNPLSFIENLIAGSYSFSCSDPSSTFTIMALNGFDVIVNLTGTGMSFFYDVTFDSNSITASGGAVATPIATTDEITCTHTPVNYTPSPNDSILTSHIAGIDNALGGVSTASDFVYVANNGSDSSGNGSFDKPFQTIAFTLSTITTATSIAPITIVLLDNVFVEPDQISLKEFVNICSITTAATINNATTIELDTTSWTSAAPYMYINNIQFAGKLNLDFTTVALTSAQYVQFNNLVFGAEFRFHCGTFNSPNGLGGVVIDNCLLFGNTFIDNVNGWVSYSNDYSGSLNFGTVDTTNRNLALFSGDIISSLTIGGGAGAPQLLTLTGCNVGSIAINGSNATLSSDVSSYVAPTVVGTPTITIRNIADGIRANYTALNYTPVSTPPTLTTSVQAHLRGIDNVLANFNIGNKSLGTTTNDNAAAGHVGEYVSSSVLQGSQISITSGTYTNITSISLTAGDWDVRGDVTFNPAVTTIIGSILSTINTVSATPPTIGAEGSYAFIGPSGGFITGSSQSLPTGTSRISIASTTTVYLIGRATFTISTCSAFGFIGARRVR